VSQHNLKLITVYKFRPKIVVILYGHSGKSDGGILWCHGGKPGTHYWHLYWHL